MERVEPGIEIVHVVDPDGGLDKIAILKHNYYPQTVTFDLAGFPAEEPVEISIATDGPEAPTTAEHLWDRARQGTLTHLGTVDTGGDGTARVTLTIPRSGKRGRGADRYRIYARGKESGVIAQRVVDGRD
jgi:hypothetical protein